MGWALKWNEVEHSWDCPCHGSRFSEDGTLLNNPANGDKVIDDLLWGLYIVYRWLQITDFSEKFELAK